MPPKVSAPPPIPGTVESIPEGLWRCVKTVADVVALVERLRVEKEAA
jgi:hypothetical protein